MFKFTPRGVCPNEISFEIHEGLIKNLYFIRGCSGNLKAISRLVEGMKVEEAISKLEGIECGDKGTSCADQLCQALKATKND